MQRTRVDALVTEKALRIANGYDNASFIDSVIDQADPDGKLFKNVCAKLSVSLSDDIDSVVGLLDISKRRFIEAALIDAVSSAHSIIQIEGVWDRLEQTGIKEGK